MCAISGIIDKKGLKVNKKDIQIMNDVMSHRGPDAEGIFTERNIGLGHRRLSIIDLSQNGNQPMVSHDERFVLVFNGEIYNYVEIKEILKQKGAVFFTKTDTEIIMEAYRYWGIDCTKYFNGMWSFALYDTVQRQLFVSRDRFGVKPLYIYESDDELVFASEIKSITAIRPEQKMVNITQMARYLAGVQEDMDHHTFYKNIYNFPKSYNMLYDLDTNTKKFHKYWEINVSELKRKWKCKNYYKKFLELLEDSIRIRLRTDVEVGASLSGGLDSSSIVGIVNKKFNTKIHTFSAVYEEKSCNEKEFIDCMNKHGNTISHYIYPEQSENLMQDLKEMVYYHDGPCHSASPYSGFCVYRGVGKHVKVLLDGQGADELFGGYLFFYNAKLKELLRKNTWISRMRAVSLIFSVHHVWPDLVKKFNDELLLQALGAKGYRNFAKKLKQDNVRGWQGEGIKYREEFKKIDLKINYKKNKSIVSELDQELNLQLQYKLLPRILHDVDRNSMARSLEVRLPFLDYRLVEFSYVLCDQYKIRRTWTKYIVRKSCKKYLPKKIYSRRNKMGFPAPFDKWISDERYRLEIKQYLDAFKDRNVIENNSLDQCYQEHMSGKRNWANQLFRIMMLEMWLQNDIDTTSYKWVMKA